MPKKRGEWVRKKRGRCPHCGIRRDLTRHHIVPQRLKTGNGASALICRDCHDHLEDVIRLLEYEVLKRNQGIYWQAVRLSKEAIREQRNDVPDLLHEQGQTHGQVPVLVGRASQDRRSAKDRRDQAGHGRRHCDSRVQGRGASVSEVPRHLRLS
jgi:hypothetical protein